MHHVVISSACILRRIRDLVERGTCDFIVYTHLYVSTYGSIASITRRPLFENVLLHITHHTNTTAVLQQLGIPDAENLRLAADSPQARRFLLVVRTSICSGMKIRLISMVESCVVLWA